MENKIKHYGRAISIIAILVMILTFSPLKAQNIQMEHWYFGQKDIDFRYTNGNSYVTNTINAPSLQQGNSFNGIYDYNGDLIFSVIDGVIIDKYGIQKGILNGFGKKNSFEISIVPIPNSCNEYYVIGSSSKNRFSNESYVSFGVVNYNENTGNIAFTNSAYLAGQTIDPSITHCGIAVSNTINSSGNRYLYIVQGNAQNSANPVGYLSRYEINSSGISNPVIVFNVNTAEYTPIEVDLSHDGSMISWGGGASSDKIFIVKNLTSTPSLVTITPNPVNIYSTHSSYHGVEFTKDGNYLYFSNHGNNAQKYDIQNNVVITISNSYSTPSGIIPVCPQIELANDGLFYIPNGINKAISLNPINDVYGEKEINFNNNHNHIISLSCIPMLPDQIDGFEYTQNQLNCCVESNIFTNTLPFSSITSTWTPTSNPFQNGQAQVSTSASFTISAGTKVTIQNMIIEFGPDAKVIVEPGATLILDNTTFTSVSCPILWQGVEVWGTYNQSQNQWSGNGLNTYQGRIVVKNSSQINNALTAIQAIKDNGNGTLDWSKTGGIIETYGSSKFINNRKAIWIGGFKNYMPGHIGDPIYIRPNRSYINYCIFETNDNFNGKMNFHSFIALFDGSLINILNNSFSNNITSSNINIKGTGIISIASPMQVKNINTFNNLLYGIKVTSFDPSVYYAIDGNSFNTCYYSIFMDHTWGAKITSNHFWIPMKDPSMSKDPFGLYLNGDNTFHVEDNEFNSDFFPGSHGIIATELGAVDNELYKNYFNGLNYGIKPQLQNKGIINLNHVGLKLFCNEFANGNTDYDILVLGQELDEPLGYKYIGIADAQKISDGINYYPAGNIFSNSHSAGTFDLDNDQADYLAYSHENNTAALRFRPDYSSNIGKVHLNPPTNSCPSKLGGGGDLSTQTILLTQAQTALNSSIVIRNIWKDGGNANLDEEVETTEPWDVYIQFNQLIAESPYLSDEVLMATIENPAFTSLMIKLIMVANPQASHNDEIMQAIYDRIPALPQSYIDEIETGESTVSQLEILEGNVSANYHLVRNIENSIINIYRLDTINTTAYSSMINLMASRQGLEDRYELSSAYLSHSDFTNMNAVLNSIPTTFSLDTKQTIEYQNNLTVFAIAQDIRENNLHPGDLSETQTNNLQSIIEQSAIDHSMALSLLLWNNPEYTINELILYKQVSGARKAKSTDIQRPETPSLFKLFPNPAHDYFTLQYSNELQSQNKLEIVITDVQGKIIRSIEFEGTIDRLISVDGLLPGVYVVSFYSDKLLLENQKLTIIK